MIASFANDATWRWGRSRCDLALAELADEDTRYLSEFGRQLRKQTLEHLRR